MRTGIKRIFNSFGIDIVRYPDPIMKGLTQILLSNNFNIVLDVGANDGWYAKNLRKLGYRGKIVSFEPLAGPFTKLSAYADKGIYDHIVVNMALGERDGVGQINVSHNLVSSSLLEATTELINAAAETKAYRTQDISIAKLDSIFTRYCNPGKDKVFLKMDVQGYEKNVLIGAQENLKHIHGIQLEVALVELYRNETLFKEMVPYIESLGFDLYLIIPGFHDQKTGRLLEVDCVFLRKEM